MKTAANRGNRKPLSGPDDPRHGTDNLYRHYNCRCEPCTEANRLKNREQRAAAKSRSVVTISDLLVECWCRTECVYVTARDVFNLRTGSCGRASCHGPEGVSDG